jgi:hypothetical protein
MDLMQDNELIDNDELIEKARQRYARDMKAKGTIYDEPSQSSYVDGDGNVVLVNVRGVLARYRPSRDAAGHLRLESLDDDADDDDQREGRP